MQQLDLASRPGLPLTHESLLRNLNVFRTYMIRVNFRTTLSRSNLLMQEEPRLVSSVCDLVGPLTRNLQEGVVWVYPVEVKGVEMR